ncbi:MAG: 30S ribosomal protein S21 [Candidatus Pacebacteria bacterium]|nr:30S ribosomal protein S21 [Candidatus Paceibacterota bacterium]
MIEIKRKEGESVNAFLYRFSKKIQQAGILKESKKRRFKKRSPNRRAMRDSALFRSSKKSEIEKQKKLGKA